MGRLREHFADGDLVVSCGYWSCVCGFPTERLICLSLAIAEAFITWGCTPTKICWGHCPGG